MARRLALLALLVCAAVAYRSPTQTSESDGFDSFEPLTLLDDSDTFESTALPRMVPIRFKSKPNKFKPYPIKPNTVKPTTIKLSTKPFKKVIIKTNSPKVNVTKTDTESGKKKKVIRTTINIASHTNFFVTDRVPVMFPFFSNFSSPTKGNLIKINDQQLWVNNVLQDSNTNKPPNAVKATTRKTHVTTKRTQVTKKHTSVTKKRTQVTTNRPQVTTKRSKVTPKRPQVTTKRPRTTTRRSVQKITKEQNFKKPCKTSNEGWISSYFRTNDIKKAPKKEVKSGWSLGFFSEFLGWLFGSRSWFNGGWLQDSEEEKSTSTTTPYPPLASDDNWFQNVVNSEETADVNSNSAPNRISKKASLKKTYNGYQLLRAYPDLQWKVRALLELQEDAEGSGLMWWSHPSLNSTADILVPPDLLADVKYQLKSSYIDFEVVIWDLQKAITYENPKMSKKQRLDLERIRGHPLTWRRYHRYADILRYLEYLQHSYSDIVELVPLGLSSEGLPLVAVKISKPTNESKTGTSINKEPNKKYKLRSHMKPAVWVEAGAHAREWIAPAVATWMLHNLVEGEKDLGGPDKEILNVADFYILPVLNPDGYEHSHTHDRLWRKTRSRTGDDSDDYYVSWFPWNWGRTECVGVDADRNWDFHWGEKDSSKDQCSENFAGPHPFSEPETRAVSEFLSEHRGRIKVYVSLHAYSQAWLLPSSQVPYADDGMMMEMGKLATTALADLYGTKYQVGTADEIRQPASGMSHDWAKARAGIKFAYHVDLRDSFGPYGFLLPGSQIVSTARETWQGIRAIVDNLSPGY